MYRNSLNRLGVVLLFLAAFVMPLHAAPLKVTIIPGDSNLKTVIDAVKEIDSQTVTFLLMQSLNRSRSRDLISCLYMAIHHSLLLKGFSLIWMARLGSGLL